MRACWPWLVSASPYVLASRCIGLTEKMRIRIPGVTLTHTTILRWVQRYAPEMERRLHSRLKPTTDSWRVDETYIRVKGKWRYLYRAVDSTVATIDFLLLAKHVW